MYNHATNIAHKLRLIFLSEGVAEIQKKNIESNRALVKLP